MTGALPGRSGSASCPLCGRPAAIEAPCASDGSDLRLEVRCASCRVFRLTPSAEYVLQIRPLGSAILADRARRVFDSTGEPIDIDVATIERVAELFRLSTPGRTKRRPA